MRSPGDRQQKRSAPGSLKSKPGYWLEQQQSYKKVRNNVKISIELRF